MKRLCRLVVAIACAATALMGVGSNAPVGAEGDDIGGNYYIGYQPGGGLRVCDWFQGGDGWFPTFSPGGTESIWLNCTVDFTHGFHIRVDAHGAGYYLPAVIDLWVGEHCNDVLIQESWAHPSNARWGLVFTNYTQSQGGCTFSGMGYNGSYFVGGAGGRANFAAAQFDGFGNPGHCDLITNEGYADLYPYGQNLPGRVYVKGGLYMRAGLTMYNFHDTNYLCAQGAWHTGVFVEADFHVGPTY